jgi:hypothetical protein
MKKTSLTSLLIFAFVLTMLPACGGGTSSTPTSSQPTTAVIKIETTGSLDPDTRIGGIEVTGVLPAGVSVKATPDVDNPSVLVTDSGVVVASGVTGTNASAQATYSPADKKVHILVYNHIDGFDTGEFVTVTCDIAAGTTPTAGSFGLVDFKPVDLLNGSAITVLTPGFTVDIF